MVQVVAIILENEKREVLLLLRDNIPTIPFPNHWDLVGGHVEEGEIPEQALVREAKEEIGYDLTDFRLFKKYEVVEGDVYPNIKFVFQGKITKPLAELSLTEGQEMRFFSYKEVLGLRLANVFPLILGEYIAQQQGLASKM